MSSLHGNLPCVVWFADKDADARSVVGAKGANLAQPVRAGSDVPPGLTVTAAAYSGFMRDTGIGDQIAPA